MILTKKLTRQRKSQPLSLCATASDKKKAIDKDIPNVRKLPQIKASLKSYPTPRGRNLCVVLNLETIPEITNLETSQSSKLPSVKPTRNATENMDYSLQPSDSSSAESKNDQVKEKANHSFQSSRVSLIKPENIDMSEDIDDSLQDLAWILQLPGLFPLDNEETRNSSPGQLDKPSSTSPHTSTNQPSIDPPISQGLSFREKPPTPRSPTVFIRYDTKMTSDPTVSKSELVCRSRVCLPQENLVQPSPSIRSQASLSKDLQGPTTELHQQQRLAAEGERNTDKPCGPPPRPPRTPPVPLKSDKRQPVPVASPPPKPPPPPWKLQDPDKKPSIQIDDPLRRPPRHPEIPLEPEQKRGDSRGSKRLITQKVFRGCKRFVDNALKRSRSSLLKDSAYSLTPKQRSVDHIQISPKPIEATIRAPPLSPLQSDLFPSSSYKKSCDQGGISTPSSRNSKAGTNSTTPSIASKAGTFLSKVSLFSSKTKLPQFFSLNEKLQEMSDSEATPNFPTIEDKYQLPELDIRSRTLLPFQCTMCFVQLNDKEEWIQHEKRHNDDDEEDSGWYWRCGICDNILHSWDDRQNHIADKHFEIGQTLSDWNSSTSPYPWDKESSKPVSRFPDWDMSILRSMQPTILDDIYRKAEPQSACGVCDLAFPTSSELDQHMKQNHVSWSCPTTVRKRKAAFFFEACRDGCDNQFHSCRCCYMSFCEDSADWKLRNQHFEEDHHFLECDHDQFFEHAQFCHHLASSHGVEIDFLHMTDLCRQKE